MTIVTVDLLLFDSDGSGCERAGGRGSKEYESRQTIVTTVTVVTMPGSIRVLL